MKKKLLNKKGFSISEILMVVLILSLIVCILGGGVVVVKNAYQRITLKAEAQTLLSTTITEVTDEFRFAGDINADKDPITFVSANEGCEIYFENAADNKGILIKNPINKDTADLLSDKTMSSGLVPQMSTYTYDEDNGTFMTEITVVNSAGKTVLSQQITVRTINP